MLPIMHQIEKHMQPFIIFGGKKKKIRNRVIVYYKGWDYKLICNELITALLE